MGGTVFTITSTRIVGLIAVVCAVVVAPQAFAAQSTHSRIPPDDLSAPNNMHFAAGQLKSVKAATKAKAKAAAIAALRRRSVDLEAAYRKLHPDAYRPAVQKSDKAAVWNFPSCIPSAAAEHDPYTYSGDPCTLSAPASTGGTTGLAPAIESDVVYRSPVSWNPVSCNGQAEYDYIYSGCEG
jgi:hypothetical protein